MHDLVHWFAKIYAVEDVIKWGGLLGMSLIVFAETGLLVGFFLPGDSLLVMAGLLTARGDLGTNILLTCLVLSAAAVVGDTVGYWFGAKSGPKLFKREDSLFFKRKHLVTTHEFYERHGGKTIILARFLPILRTFAPVVAGIGRMEYRRFLAFNIVGGFGWVFSLGLLSYYLGLKFPSVFAHVDAVIVVVIAVSLMPGAITLWLNHRRDSRAKQSAPPPPAPVEVRP